MSPRPLIEIVEDDDDVAESLLDLLDSWGYRVSRYDRAEAYLNDDGHGKGACLLLDLRLPGMDGLALLRQLRERLMRIPVVVLTGHGDVNSAVDALKHGADDFIEKPFDDVDLVERIRAALARRGGPSGDPASGDPGGLDALTPRERQVLEGVVAGHSNKEIAYRLGISIKTIEAHRGRVMHKTGARNVSHLVRMALGAGVSPDFGDG